MLSSALSMYVPGARTMRPTAVLARALVRPAVVLTTEVPGGYGGGDGDGGRRGGDSGGGGDGGKRGCEGGGGEGEGGEGGDGGGGGDGCGAAPHRVRIIETSGAGVLGRPPPSRTPSSSAGLRATSHTSRSFTWPVNIGSPKRLLPTHR
jgi:hypothetical protein